MSDVPPGVPARKADTVRNLDTWYAAFEVQTGDKLYPGAPDGPRAHLVMDTRLGGHRDTLKRSARKLPVVAGRRGVASRLWTPAAGGTQLVASLSEAVSYRLDRLGERRCRTCYQVG